jgi:hypothetical protein
MSFRLNINERDVVIKVRHAFSEDGVYEFPFTGRIVDFTVPTSGVYKIEAWGARGGSDSPTTGPLGAYSKSFALLNKDEVIQILVGEKGYPGIQGSTSYKDCGGGGGGTFIAKGNAPFCVAGGGGGLSYIESVNSAIQSHACGQATQLSANFESAQASLKMGGKPSNNAGGGGGFVGDGDDGTGQEHGKGGISFLNGGSRQTLRTAGNYGYGGFGGGGSRHGNCGRGAGGGGYTGGSGSKTTNQGGGGGSYFEGNFSNEAISFAISGCDSSIPSNPGTNGNGFAILTLLKSHSNDAQVKKMSYCNCNCFKVQFLWTLYVTLLSQ